MEFKDQAAYLDLTVRVYCLEKLLLDKGIMTKEELVSEFSAASEKLMRDILKAADYKGDVEEAIKLIKKSPVANVN